MSGRLYRLDSDVSTIDLFPVWDCSANEVIVPGMDSELSIGLQMRSPKGTQIG
jgi:hypothetical protein